MFQSINNNYNKTECNSDDNDDDDDDDDDDSFENENLDDNKLNHDLELFQQFNKLKLNFYKKYVKLYENDSMTSNHNNENVGDDSADDNDDEDFYDALSQSSLSIKK